MNFYQYIRIVGSSVISYIPDWESGGVRKTKPYFRQDIIIEDYQNYIGKNFRF